VSTTAIYRAAATHQHSSGAASCWEGKYIAEAEILQFFSGVNKFSILFLSAIFS